MDSVTIGDRIETKAGAITVKDIYIEGLSGLRPRVQVVYTYELPDGRCGKETASIEAFLALVKEA